MSGSAGSGASGGATTGSGGQGAGMTAATGSGGQGAGTTVTTGSGGSPCDIDCSSIDTPDCTVAVCDEAIGECVIVPDQDGTVCDDGLFCTVNDTCLAGICTGGAGNDCGLSANECDQVICDEMTASCTQTPLPNGTACINNNPCVVNSTCQSGLCVGQPKDCSMTPLPNSCHTAQCNPQNGNCLAVPANDGFPCFDPINLCTENNTCSNGSCFGGNPKDCSALNGACTVGQCDVLNGQCFANPLPAGSICGTVDDCNSGICNGGGQCQGSPINEGGACNDGLSCTMGTTCTMGNCGGGSGATVYFVEDFSNNSAGWTLGTEWQIGPAMVSSGGVGNPDPGQDHSITADNGIAGAVIGGNIANTPHPMAYITSPPINTSTVPGALYLSYQRWLNSDYLPYMANQVEVFNGTGWQVVWQSSGPPPIQDAMWSGSSHDISAFKATNMQVRFGFAINQNGAFTVSGWNLDDVVIADSPCP